MKPTIDRRTYCPQVGPAGQAPRSRRHITRILLALVCLTSLTAVHAQKAGEFDGALGYDSDMPWMPEVITAVDQYVQDPAFRLRLDHFAAANTLDQQGLFTAQLANGNTVTVGLVPDGAGGGTCSDGTKLCSIGLVRYSQTGQHVPWPNAGAYGRDSNNYLVYPGALSSSRYQFLHDIKVRGQYIDVLVDVPDIGHPALTLGHRNVLIVTFRDDGSFLSSWTAFGFGWQPLDNEDFYGAQMVQMINNKLIVAATAYDGGKPYIAVNRVKIRADGSLTQDSWGVDYAGEPNTINDRNRIARYFPPTALCGAARCAVVASYVANQVGFAEQRDFFVAGSIDNNNGNDWDPIAVKISSIDGSQKAEFNSGGWRRVAFDNPGSNMDDRTAGIYVYQDDVYMAASVSRACRAGIGLARVNGASGSLIPFFGNNGTIIFGGDDGFGGVCPTLGSASSNPTAIAATGGRIGIVGYEVYRNLSNNIQYNPMLAVVNAVTGNVLSFDSYAVTRGDGTRYGDATLSGIYGGNLGTSPFTVSGVVRDAGAGNTLSYLTGKLIPVSADRIFASGFGGDDY